MRLQKLLFIYLSFYTVGLFAQQKMVTKSGRVTFEASVPLFEEVTATNEKAHFTLNSTTGEVVSFVLMKEFRFKKALMEEHFNENYMESDRYPKATFKGKIELFDIKKITKTPQIFTIKGKMELHGKTKNIISVAKIRTTADGIEIISTFEIEANAFGIEIPSAVKNKISNTIEVKSEFIVK